MIRVTDHGSIVQFFPFDKRGEDFLHTFHTEHWQWLGCSLCVDHRFARLVIEAANEEGIEVS